VRHIPTVVLLVVAAACATLPRNSETAAREVVALEEEWIRAVIQRDSAAFDRLLAPSFLYTEDDRVYSKDALIAEVTKGTDTVTAGRNEGLDVRVTGNTAIATGWLVLSGRGASGPFERRYRYTDTWMYLDGRWRVLAAQDYLKP
jgi:ketosteroid isomerase-like protein